MPRRSQAPLDEARTAPTARALHRATGSTVLGVIRPIENAPDCSNAACHVHPPSQRMLGVIDANLSLATVDAQIAQQQASLTLVPGGRHGVRLRRGGGCSCGWWSTGR